MPVDYFLKIDGIDGESQQKSHEGEIEIDSFSWSESNEGSSAVGGGRGAGKVSMADFSFSMTVNKASPKLFLYCATGKNIPEISLTCREQGGEQEEYLKMKFTDSIVSSFQTGGSEGIVKPLDQVSINFTKIEYSYAAQKEDGTLEAYETHFFDLKKSEYE